MDVAFSKYEALVYVYLIRLLIQKKGRRGHDRMVVGFTTTCAIRAYAVGGSNPLMERCTWYNIMW